MLKKTAAVFILAAAFVFLFCAAASAGPTNPKRPEMLKMQKFVQQAKQKRGSKADRGEPLIGISLSGDLTSGNTVQITATVSGLESMDGYTLVWWLQDADRDPSGCNYYQDASMNSATNEYSIEYTFYSAGNYSCFINIYDASDEFVAWEYADFTISGDQTIEKKVASVVSECQASSEWQTALNLYDWLTHHLYYDGSYSFYGPDAILRGYGVCDSYSKCYVLLCRAAGIAVERTTSYDHAWNTLMIDGKWYQADPTWDDPNSWMPGEGSAVSGWEGHDFFCLNSDIMQSIDSHELESGVHASECTSLDANYYIYTGQWRNWGGYEYDDEIGRYVCPITEIIAAVFNQGTAIWNYNSDTGFDGWFVYENDSGTHIMYADNTYRKLLVYAISQNGVTLENGGPATVVASLINDGFNFRLTGWNIPDAGVLALPSETETIEEYAFQGVDASIVTIPPMLNAVGAKAFADSSVRTVYFSDQDVQLDDSAFDNCGRLIFVTDNQKAIEYADDHGYLVLAP